MHQSLAQLDLQHLHQPPLTDIENQQTARNHKKHAQLEQEVSQIASRQGVIKRFVPTVKPNLAVGGEDDLHDDPRHDQP